MITILQFVLLIIRKVRKSGHIHGLFVRNFINFNSFLKKNALDSRCLLKNGLKTLTFFVPESQQLGSNISVIEVAGDPGRTILLKIENNNSPITVVPFTKTVQLRKKLDKENETGPSLVSVNLLCERLSIHHNFKENIEPFVIPVVIHVIDENDNPPIFLNEPITYNVSEATKVGVKLLPRILASDKDKSGQYSRIHYSIVPSLYSDFIKFENDLDGVLVLKKTLDYETFKYFVVHIHASDEGEPVQVTETTVQINVVDIDDNNPKFISDVFYGFLPFNETVFKQGLLVNVTPNGHVEAYDQDFGINAPINYYFNSNDYFDQYFMIDRVSGVIRLRKSLPVHEVQQPISLIVRASQADNPDKFAICKVVVSIFTKTVKFLKKLHRISVLESLPSGSSVIELQLNQPLNPNLKFFISEANLVDLVSVGRRGELILNQPLDYETTDLYRFKVFVTDGHFNDTTNVEIQVLNVNDWEPRFRYPVYEFFINNNDYMSNFGRIEVADGDKNDSLTLTLSGRNASMFVINSRGDLSLKPNVHSIELSGEAIFTVTAFDSGGKKSSIPVVVHFPSTFGTTWNQIQKSKSSASALIIAFFILLGLFTVILSVLIAYMFKKKRRSDTKNDDNRSQVNNPVFSTEDLSIPNDFYKATVRNIISNKSAKRNQAPRPPTTSSTIIAAPVSTSKKHETFWSYTQNLNKKSSWTSESQYKTDCEQSETMNRIETINVNNAKRRPINDKLTVYF